ncbi:hypothetical protein V2A60_008678 [Cordyceps javanica]
MASTTKLFQPVRVGNVHLKHRVVMAPLTRFRSDLENVPLPNMLEYYTQRASEPGTLIIVEATGISPNHCGGQHAPGLWSDAQVDAFKKLTDAIHETGCSTFVQLCAPGRAGNRGEGYPLYSSSAVPMHEGAPVPKEMTEQDIRDVLRDFVGASKNAIRAGFDGVELHGANGYLIDQFTQDTCNKRTDSWGGSVANRSRFILEIADSVAAAIGSDRLAVRLSPWSKFQAMKMEKGPALQQFSHVISELKKLRPAYIHLIESRVVNNVDCEKEEGLEFAFDIWANQSPILVAGGFNSGTAREAVDVEYAAHNTLIVFGRYFVSTPDLVFRLKRGIKPNPYDRLTFYTPVQAKGYIDYPFSKEYLEKISA